MRSKRLISFLMVAALATSVSLAVSASPAVARDQMRGFDEQGAKGDDKMHPLGERRRALRQQALEAVARGHAKGKVHEVAKGQFVELEREGEDSIWTVLGEFGDFNPVGGLPGPQYNQIPEPDRDFDNTTIWTDNFDTEHYMELLFSEADGAASMRNFYIEQSSGRYAVNGEVTDWVQVPYNTTVYRGAWACGPGPVICSTVWWFVEDSVNAWYAAQEAAGMTGDEINDYLSQFDVWDRYDYDGDGDFDEPDGYIDHFQSVHAGEGQEAGGGAYGSDAIWSHRWYAYFNFIGVDGPPFNLAGGIQIGDSDYWVGDYTIEPENGGVGVFAHEFGHDLDLPDLYNTGPGPSNSTGFWTLMSSGSWLNDGTVDIGSKPSHMGAWEKLQLGWLNYEVAHAGRKSVHKLGPAETNTKKAQGLIVVLPDKEVITEIGDPYAGDYFYYSGRGNNLDNFMYREFNLPAGSWLNAQVNYDIEQDWDYAYVVASTDGGMSWTSVATNLSTNFDPHGNNRGEGITGFSGGWDALSADLSAYTGSVMLGFRYNTDSAVDELGFMVDEIVVDGYPTDGAETDAGWIYMPGIRGFQATDGQSLFHFNAYIAEFRQYRDFDESLETGPYNFGFQDNPSLLNWVERFPYQDGLLISYWDSTQANNNTASHPGEGLILPIDAHPETMYRADGQPWFGRQAAYDSTFGLEPTEAITLHWDSQPSDHPSLPAVPVFDDTIQYWNPNNDTPWLGVKNPNTGTQIIIRNTSAHGTFMQVEVRPKKK